MTNPEGIDEERNNQDYLQALSGVGSSQALHPQFGIWAMTPDPELEKIQHFLAGDEPYFDDETKELKWKTGVHDPILNDQGRYELMMYLHEITSKIVSLSDIAKEQYYQDLMSNAFGVSEFLFINYRKFELKPSNYSFLCLQLVNIIETSFAKARDKASMEFIHPKYRGTEFRTTQTIENPKEKGFISSLLSLGKKG